MQYPELVKVRDKNNATLKSFTGPRGSMNATTNISRSGMHKRSDESEFQPDFMHATNYQSNFGSAPQTSMRRQMHAGTNYSVSGFNSISNNYYQGANQANDFTFNPKLKRHSL